MSNSPFLTFLTTYIDLLKIRDFFSFLLGPRYSLPKANQALFASFIKFLNSSGSREKSSSTLPSFFLRTICFSIIVAPKTTELTAAAFDNVWSEKPISQLNLLINVLIARILDSTGSVG